MVNLKKSRWHRDFLKLQGVAFVKIIVAHRRESAKLTTNPKLWIIIGYSKSWLCYVLVLIIM
jgi:hypothetical protein